MIRRLLLRYALRELRVQVSPATGALFVWANGQPIPRGVKVLVSWPGRSGLGGGR